MTIQFGESTSFDISAFAFDNVFETIGPTTSGFSEPPPYLYTTNEGIDVEVVSLIKPNTGIVWVYSQPNHSFTPTLQLSAFSTTDLPEGLKLYWTSDRTRYSISGTPNQIIYDPSTGEISIDPNFNPGGGSGANQNLDTSAFPTFAGLTIGNYDGYLKGISGVLSAVNLSTSDVTEGINRYFTESRARYAVSGTTNQIDYDVSTGIISISPNFAGGGTGTTQNLDTSAAPTFAGLILTNYNGYLKGNSSGVLSAVNLSTSDVTEGTHLYFTAGRVDAEVESLIQNSASLFWNIVGSNYKGDVSLSAFSTSDLLEGSNLYWTSNRTRYSVSGTTNQISYSPTTGVFAIDSNYVGQTSLTTLGIIATGTWNASTIHPNFGGTGLTTSGTANQLLGANRTGSGLEYKTIVGGANVYVNHAAGVITISATGGGGGGSFDQNLNTFNSPTFAGLTLTNYNGYLKGDSSGILSAVNISTSDVSEGNNLYFTNDRVTALLINTDSLYWSTASSSISATVSLSGFSTTNLSEGSNLYWTSNRTRFSVSGTPNQLDYNTSTGVFSISPFFGAEANQNLDTSASPTFKGLTLTNYNGYLKGDSSGVLSAVNISTSDITEGSHLYFTTGRVDTEVESLIQNSPSLFWNIVGSNYKGDISLSAFSTTNLGEGSNLYWTSARTRFSVSGTSNQIDYNTATGAFSISPNFGIIPNQNLNTSASPTFSGLTLTNYNGYLKGDSSGVLSAVSISTSDISEGSRLYFTTGRVDTEVETLIQNSSSLFWNVVGSNYKGDISLSAFSTSNLSEGSNLYWTSNRTRFSVSGTTNQISYSTTTGIVGIDVGYVGQTSITTLGTIATGTWNGTSVHPKFGGTGLTTSGTSNQLLGANASGTLLEYKTIVGGSNVFVNHTAGTITISAGAPNQNLDTSATPTFAGLTLTNYSGYLKGIAGVVSAVNISTSDVTEGSNLYWTSARTRFSISATTNQIDYNTSTGVISISPNFGIVPNQNLNISASPTFAGLTLTNYSGYIKGSSSGVLSAVNISTSDVIEGSRLYFTTARVDTEVEALIQNSSSLFWNVAGSLYKGDVSLSAFSTTNLSEGNNLYWTSNRTRFSVSGTANQISYSTTTGVIGIDAAYVGQSSLTTLGTIATGVWNGTVVHPKFGGTGIATSGTANQVFGANAGGTLGEYKTLTQGTGVTITHGANAVTFAIGQAVATTSVPSFGGLTLSNLTPNRQVITDGTSALSSNIALIANGFVMATGTGTLSATIAPTNGQLLIGNTGGLPSLSTITGGSGLYVNNTAGAITVSALGGPATGFAVVVDGSGFVLSAGNITYVTLPFAGTISNWFVTADASGSVSADVLSGGTSMVGTGNGPSLASAQRNNAAPSGWTSTTFATNAELSLKILSATTVTKVTFNIFINKS